MSLTSPQEHEQGALDDQPCFSMRTEIWLESGSLGSPDSCPSVLSSRAY